MFIKRKYVLLDAYGAGHLGDALCLSPVVRQLHEACSMSVYLTRRASTEAVFTNNPFMAGFQEKRGFCRFQGKGHLIQRLQAASGCRWI